jgi:type IV pilus assembly protein PilM
VALFSRKASDTSRPASFDKGARKTNTTQPSYSAVGVDISTSAVKVLEMDRGRDGYKATKVGIEPLPRDAIVERAISNLDAVGEALTAALKRSRSKRKNAIVAVASSHVVTRTIHLPAELNDSELEEQVGLEAVHHIPYSLDEVNMDYLVIGPSATDPDANEILLSACRREIVEDYAAVVASAGLQPVIIDVDSFAVERAYSLVTNAFGDSIQGKVIGLLDYGDTTTHLDVFVDGKIEYSRDHAFGGRILTENIRTRYANSHEEAEIMKLSLDLPENYVADLLEPFKASMAQEANRAIEFFASSSRSNEGVDAIFLTGGCAAIDGATDVIQQVTGFDTFVANPFAGSESRGKSQALGRQTPLLFKACGLAMRGTG